MDKSNGYEDIAAIFIASRGQAVGGIGTAAVRKWAKLLPPKATVLDLGCGPGIPIAQLLLAEGLRVYGLDASPAMVAAFRQNFPMVPVVCEAVEESLFFQRLFDAVVAWGLLFLLPAQAQELVIYKAARALQAGGRLLFTAPAQAGTWRDSLTGRQSTSLGAEHYRAIVAAASLSMEEENTDEGQNDYYQAVKH
ncbi:class I SAM-dependent methyltransferase [Hymenobacter sp. YC55]|uniref:class I SAM-dependent methyltransferase n=1 Tax=Hymenobacter sp. YC55 TaxID=3034019 RepID=UPI0023F688FF|nr:class I SAM-dependent methyltransferase [Hymenobacter sp. YC55]MDF7815719.1 class I SAM-dependent methyltransferase [Hymenobacter sp. YC55]